MNYFYKFSLVIIFVLSGLASFATHLKGGEIRVARISGLTYKFTALIYFDHNTSVIDDMELMICTGDGQAIKADRVGINALPSSASTLIGTFETTYTYAASGRYQVSTALSNRNSGIINFPNSASTPLFLWTVLNTELPNSTPLFPHLQFEAGVKQLFSLDLKSSDAEGDSISFRLQRLSRSYPGTCGIRGIEQSYDYPNDVSKSGSFKIDQLSKKLLWNAPAQIGNYAFAIVADEWRDGIIISQSYREGIINVIDRPGQTVEIPPYEAAADNGVLIAMSHVDSPEISLAVEAFPVPTDDVVTVKAYSKKQSVIILQLIDMQGRILQQIVSRAAETLVQEQFDLRNYTKGIYLIRAKNDTGSVTQKILR